MWPQPVKTTSAAHLSSRQMLQGPSTSGGRVVALLGRGQRRRRHQVVVVTSTTCASWPWRPAWGSGSGRAARARGARMHGQRRRGRQLAQLCTGFRWPSVCARTRATERRCAWSASGRRRAPRVLGDRGRRAAFGQRVSPSASRTVSRVDAVGVTVRGGGGGGGGGGGLRRAASRSVPSGGGDGAFGSVGSSSSSANAICSAPRARARRCSTSCGPGASSSASLHDGYSARCC